MEVADILIIVMIVLAVAAFALYQYNRKIYKKTIEAEDFIAQNKVTTQIFVIDKKKERPNEHNLPKNVYSQLNRMAKIRKMAMIRAKVGPQIVTLLCDNNVYDVLTPKKTVKVELAGLYITSVIGVNLADKKEKTIPQKAMLYLKERIGGGKK